MTNTPLPGGEEGISNCPPSASDEASSGKINGSSETRHVAPPDAVEQLSRRIQAIAERWKGVNGGIYTIRAMSLDMAHTLMEENALPCAHDWKVWPETDGLEQRCMKCGAYRRTPSCVSDGNPAGEDRDSGGTP